MIKRVTFYIVKCDRCGKQMYPPGGPHLMKTLRDAEDATALGWRRYKGGYRFCGSCDGSPDTQPGSVKAKAKAK